MSDLPTSPGRPTITGTPEDAGRKASTELPPMRSPEPRSEATPPGSPSGETAALPPVTPPSGNRPVGRKSRDHAVTGSPTTPRRPGLSDHQAPDNGSSSRTRTPKRAETQMFQETSADCPSRQPRRWRPTERTASALCPGTASAGGWRGDRATGSGDPVVVGDPNSASPSTSAGRTATGPRPQRPPPPGASATTTPKPVPRARPSGPPSPRKAPRQSRDPVRRRHDLAATAPPPGPQTRTRSPAIDDLETIEFTETTGTPGGLSAHLPGCPVLRRTRQ